MTTRTVRQPHLPVRALVIIVAAVAVLATSVAVGTAIRTGGSSPNQVETTAATAPGADVTLPAAIESEPFVIYVVGSNGQAADFAQLLAEHEVISAALGARPQHFSIVIVGEGASADFWTAAGDVDYVRATNGAPPLSIHDLRTH